MDRVHVSDWHLVSDGEEVEQEESWKEKYGDIESCLMDDDKEKFVQIIRSLLYTRIFFFEIDSGVMTAKDEKELSSLALGRCVQWRAFLCAKALLEGETGLPVNLNAPLDRYLFPLHLAAEESSYTFTELFLKMGAQPDVEYDFHYPKSCCCIKWKPLHFALDSLKRSIWSTKQESVFRLMMELFSAGMNEPVKTLRLLLKHSSRSEVSDLICHHACEGNAIQLAALYVAATAEMDISIVELHVPADSIPGEQMSLRQHIINQIVLLSNEECKLAVVGNGDSKLVECRNKKNAKMSVLMLLEIFMRMGCYFANLCALWDKYPANTGVTEEFVIALSSAGFELTDEDCENLECSRGILRVPIESHSLKEPFQPNLQTHCLYETYADTGSIHDRKELKNLLPLHRILEKLCSTEGACPWTPKESLFKLIAILCLPDMNEILENCRVLAHKKERLNELAWYYAKNGEIIALAILLLVAREEAMEPIYFQVDADFHPRRLMTFENLINSELGQAIDLEYRSMFRKGKEEKDLGQLCGRRKSAMISSLMLLQIFEKAGATLECYMLMKQNNVQKEQTVDEGEIWPESQNNVQEEQIVENLKLLFETVGLNVKFESIRISCAEYRSMAIALSKVRYAMQSQKENADKTLESTFHNGRNIILRPSVFVGGLPDTYSTFGMSDTIRKLLLRDYRGEASAIYRRIRAYWTSRAFSSSCFPNVSRIRLKETSKGVGWHVHMFPIGKLWASFALAIRRAIRRGVKNV